MATKEEVATIAKIQNTIRKAKAENKKPAAELSRGIEKYHRALNFIRESGFFIMVLVPIGYVLFLITFLGTVSPYISLSDTLLGEVLIRISLCTLLALVAVVLGYKVRSLTMTPKATIASLIGLLLIEIVFFGIGILGLLAWTTTICGIVKWSTYKEWFYRFGDDGLEDEGDDDEEEEDEDDEEEDEDDGEDEEYNEGEEEYDEEDEYLDDPYL